MENHLLHFQVILTTLDEKMCKEVFLFISKRVQNQATLIITGLDTFIRNITTYLKLKFFKIELTFLD